MDRKSLEQSLFTWDKWDAYGPMTLSFYDVELIAQVGEFPVGTKFKQATLDAKRSVLVLQNENEEHVFSLSLSVGDKLPLEEVYPGACGLDSQEDGCDCGETHDHQ